ncbi:MAG TPA: S8 family serine peptidase [Solirubrobacteraceae bacterium]|nr:S8 family serine peptidase [Solirubrobacteraceae bacterium]
MLRRTLLSAALGAALLASPAEAAEHVPGEVVVRYQDADGGLGRTEVVETGAGESVDDAIAELREAPRVLSATPNVIARTALVPNDPGRGTSATGWQALQWNFAGPFGVNAPAAWDNVAAAGRPGGADVVVAVLDTGVAYATRGRFLRSPDFETTEFVPGKDFVDRDRFPHDLNGHGTHVTSTIAESVDNAVGVTGLAYGARIMPVRVLNRNGEGDSASISKGIRWATRHGADVINLSFEFGETVRARQIPNILDALHYATRRGALVVGAAGNEGVASVAYPARARNVLSVGATTEHGCLAEYSNTGVQLDITAPGGGPDADFADDPNCRPLEEPGRDIYQMTFTRNVRTFGLPARYMGTSMAAPHVTATAALVIASGVLGPDPTPAQVGRRLLGTARDLGLPGADNRYGAGLVDAAAATAAAPAG